MSATIADARRLAGDEPLTFEVGDSVPANWDGFDVAFSHEASAAIADARRSSLARSGRRYYAVRACTR